MQTNSSFFIPSGTKVLVTGATGFTGTVLVRKLLESRAMVRAIARNSSDLSPFDGKPIEWIRGEINDPEIVKKAVEGAVYVFHLVTAYRDTELSDEAFDKVDLQGTQRMAEAASHEPSLKRFVHVSTCGVHSHIEDPPADENYRMKPDDIYQRKKAEAEIWIRQFAEQNHFPLTVVRPAGIYGPGDRRLLKLFKLACGSWFPVMGKNRGLFHMIHVEDLADFLITAALHPNSAGEVFICGNEEALPLRRLVEIIAQAYGDGPKVRFVRLPAGPLFFLADCCERICKPFGIRPPLFRRRIAFFTKDRAFNTQKMRKVLGFFPKFSYEEGIRQTLQWYLDQGWMKRKRRKFVQTDITVRACREQDIFFSTPRHKSLTGRLKNNYRPTHILKVIDKLGYGGRMHGTGKNWLTVLEFYDRTRLHIVPYVLRLDPKIHEIFLQRGIVLRGLQKGRFDPTTIWDLYQIIRKEKIDVAHLHGYGASAFGRIAAWLAGVPAIIQQHDSMPSFWAVRICDRLLAPLTQKAVAVSKSVAEFCVHDRFIPPERVAILENALHPFWKEPPDENEVADLRRSLRLRENMPILGTVSRFSHEKDIPNFLRAAGLLMREGKDFQILLVGDGPHRPEIQRQIEQNNLSGRVCLTGFQHHVKPYLALIDIFVLSSVNEAFPNALLEAMAMSKSVIVTAVGAMNEMIRQAKNGLKVPPKNPAAMGAALKKLMEEPAFARRLADQAGRDVEQYSISQYQDSMEALCREVLESAGEKKKKNPSGRLRILNIIDRYSPELGGAGQIARRCAAVLSQKGFEISFLTRLSRKESSREDEVDGNRVIRRGRSRLRIISKIKFFFSGFYFLIRSRDQYDLLHIHCTMQVTEIMAGFLASLVTQKPYVIHIHGSQTLPWLFHEKKKLEAKHFNPNLIPSWIWKKAFQRAKAIISLNSEIDFDLEQNAIRHYVRIPNGVEIPPMLSEKPALRKKLDLPEEAKIAIFAGSLVPEKNLISLLKAWKLVEENAKKNEIPVQLLILGGKSSSALETVAFKGFVFPVMDYLMAADIFVFPSLSEGMPMALLEAMACGLAPAVSKIEPHMEMIPSEEYGLLFDPLRPEEMALCIQNLFSDPQKAKKIGENARKRVAENYNIQKTAERVAKLYDSILGNRSQALEFERSREPLPLLNSAAN